MAGASNVARASASAPILRPKSSSSSRDFRGASASGRPSSHEIAHAEMRTPVGTGDLDERFAALCAQHARSDIEVLRDVHQRLLLRLEHGPILARVRDLEHDARTAFRLDAEILIALARERRCPPLSAEVLARDALRVAQIEAWTVFEHGAKS